MSIALVRLSQRFRAFGVAFVTFFACTASAALANPAPFEGIRDPAARHGLLLISPIDGMSLPSSPAAPEDILARLRRGFELAASERVLLCDDILTTGRSLREVVSMAEGYAAEIVGLGVACRLAAATAERRARDVAARRDRLEDGLRAAFPGLIVHAGAVPRLPNTADVAVAAIAVSARATGTPVGTIRYRS